MTLSQSSLENLYRLALLHRAAAGTAVREPAADGVPVPMFRVV